MNGIRIAIIILLVIVSLFMLACGSGNVVSSISLAVQAAELAVPIIGYANLSPEVQAAAVSYLHLANTALNEVTVILQSGGPAAVQAAKITSTLSRILTPQLPSGTPQAIVDAIQKIANAAAQILTNFAQDGKPKLLPPSYHYKITKSDQQKIQEAQERLSQNKQEIDKLRR